MIFFHVSLLISDCGQSKEENGPVVLTSEGERAMLADQMFVWFVCCIITWAITWTIVFMIPQDLEERIAQEEGTGQALRVDAMRQEGALQQLRLAVKEVIPFCIASSIVSHWSVLQTRAEFEYRGLLISYGLLFWLVVVCVLSGSWYCLIP